MEQLAKAIGYMVYAVARSDGKVNDAEKKAVHDIINDRWDELADSEDPFGVRTLDYVDKMLELLDQKEISVEEAFEQFELIYREDSELFTKEIRELLLDICIRTGSAFNMMNKSELVTLSRFQQLFKS